MNDIKILKERKKRFSEELKRKSIPAFLVSNNINIRYLTGFSCSFGYLVFIDDDYFLLTDSRYESEAVTGAYVDEIINTNYTNVYSDIKKLLTTKAGKRKISFEPDFISWAEFNKLDKELAGIKLNPDKNTIQKLRTLKDISEIRYIKKASSIMDKAFRKLVNIVEPGMTESRIRGELESLLIKDDIEKLAFDTIVASGPRGAFAHGKPSAKKVKNGEFIVIDFGACCNGYNSDMTRTIHIGKPDKESKRRYNAVYDAQCKSLEKVFIGEKICKSDILARDILEKFGYERYFTHSLGHGVGMDVHESPGINSLSKAVYEDGMVFTIEPGIYIEGWGGIRIEDTVAIVDNKPVRLTGSTKKLICI